ncbi:sulfur carrier protein ThiS [Phocea massiliensis]|uniref:Sulfur carrier protein ThiS n=1 Tax=Merdimmobilis hominis TaxID=2897707 RepID=A0A938X9J1_9FIRM|nr:sulfur carrier protein ThiS [Merdimmobilis hominis]MBM6921989.1 sulfur carrier protein ThiS [Merdimmobilis hominis]
MVRINGTDEDVCGMTIASYLAENQYDSTRIAVEKNGEIVPKSQYDTATLCDGDTVEIVRFVGGG